MLSSQCCPHLGHDLSPGLSPALHMRPRISGGRAAANLRWISKEGEGERPLARTWPNHPTNEEPVTPVGLRPQRHSSLEWDEPRMFTALVCLSHRHVLLPPVTSCQSCHQPHPNPVHLSQLRGYMGQGSQIQSRGYTHSCYASGHVLEHMLSSAVAQRQQCILGPFLPSWLVSLLVSETGNH